MYFPVIIDRKQVMTLMKVISVLFWCSFPRDEGMREDRYANRTQPQVLQLITNLDIPAYGKCEALLKRVFLYEFGRAKCFLG